MLQFETGMFYCALQYAVILILATIAVTNQTHLPVQLSLSLPPAIGNDGSESSTVTQSSWWLWVGQSETQNSWVKSQIFRPLSGLAQREFGSWGPDILSTFLVLFSPFRRISGWYLTRTWPVPHPNKFIFRNHANVIRSHITPSGWY
jgi:hypothetical protein